VSFHTEQNICLHCADMTYSKSMVRNSLHAARLRAREMTTCTRVITQNLPDQKRYVVLREQAVG
jgi:hypothetical protein